MTKHLFVFVIAGFLALPLAVYAQEIPELHITPDGKFSAKNMVVFQKIGTSAVFTKLSWGKAVISVRVSIDSKTVLQKVYGGTITSDDIKDGHLIDVEGRLTEASDNFSVIATKVRDRSLTEELKTTAGTIKTIDIEHRLIIIHGKTYGTTTVAVPSGITIKKGALTRNLTQLAIGDVIISAPGTFDHQTKIFTPTRIELFQNKNIYAAKNYQGALKSVSSNTLPATLVVIVDGKDHTVYVKEGVKILNKAKAPSTLGRFEMGDLVRFHGPRRESDQYIIDATVLRNLNF